MSVRTLAASLGALLLASCGAGAASDVARFEWFDYAGADPVFSAPVPEGSYQNPVLAGFYPDPGITQVGGDYYLVNSTFAYYPGIPVFHSTDLVNWTQIGNAIDRPGMLDFDGLGLSRGVFAPTIDHHNGTFYIANTCVDCGGNFIIKATDPAGPWSDPIWLPKVGGIDPSLFFDDDGKVYLMNNDAPVGEPRYDGHRAIWIREVDPETFDSISEPVVIIDGGVRPEEKPIWIEGPHIYKVDGRYYLSAAEGGTAEGHSQVVLRGASPLGPFTPNPKNPILTQRNLPRDRANPITSVGHADYVQDNEGQWWATFLGVRPYEGDFYNTGRETFLMRVQWKDGWPVITQGLEEVPYVAPRPALPPSERPAIPMTGNFELREEFDADLGPHWLFVRVPKSEWWSVRNGALLIEPRGERLGDGLQPSLVTRRQQHTNATATTLMRFKPGAPDAEAGIVAMQSDEHYYAFGLGLDEAGQTVLRVRKRAGADDPARGAVVAETPLAADGPVRLRIEAKADVLTFSYAEGEEGAFTTLLDGADGKILSTRTAGGFVGATFGMYAEGGAKPAA